MMNMVAGRSIGREVKSAIVNKSPAAGALACPVSHDFGARGGTCIGGNVAPHPRIRSVCPFITAFSCWCTLSFQKGGEHANSVEHVRKLWRADNGDQSVAQRTD